MAPGAALILLPQAHRRRPRRRVRRSAVQQRGGGGTAHAENRSLQSTPQFEAKHAAQLPGACGTKRAILRVPGAQTRRVGGGGGGTARDRVTVAAPRRRCIVLPRSFSLSPLLSQRSCKLLEGVGVSPHTGGREDPLGRLVLCLCPKIPAGGFEPDISFVSATRTPPRLLLQRRGKRWKAPALCPTASFGAPFAWVPAPGWRSQLINELTTHVACTLDPPPPWLGTGPGVGTKQGLCLAQPRQVRRLESDEVANSPALEAFCACLHPKDPNRAFEGGRGHVLCLEWGGGRLLLVPLPQNAARRRRRKMWHVGRDGPALCFVWSCA
eukprot:gene11330-biopygen13921